MDKLYLFLTSLVAPLMPLWLHYRRRIGKEDRERMQERFGITNLTRPEGTLVWLHAASVGESNSMLPLIHKICAQFPTIWVLITTGTVTSAQLMKQRLPERAVHQYVPIDTPEATRRFIRHWRPDIALWVESEFWPNLVREANDYQCFMAVINGRMSQRSFLFWQKHPTLINKMLSSFDYVFAQSEQDATRFKILGAKEVLHLGNMKFDGESLPCNENELFKLKAAVGARPIWLAASTHPGEEEIVASVHKSLILKRPTVLTVIVPRHPDRGAAIADTLGKYFRVALRSRKDPITPDTSFYIADTLGELGLFYRLCEIVFMGGSLVRHGGQNPLEPARLACAIINGPYTYNFAEIYSDMEQAGASVLVLDAKQLADRVGILLNNPAMADSLQTRSQEWVESKTGATDELLKLLAPLLRPGDNNP
ncbi:MAG: 3-deoxy-D-manno-octulosonic acid transferase [Rickettsiales bacterium]|nr:3-deoxy-D-manno-octulosonic acid transferase [Rickettsiales bacterium]